MQMEERQIQVQTELHILFFFFDEKLNIYLNRENRIIHPHNDDQLFATL